MSVELPKKFESIVVNAADEWLETRGMTREQLRPGYLLLTIAIGCVRGSGIVIP